MTKEQIVKMQQQLKTFYPKINQGGCGLFAYAFVSRIGGKALKLGNKSSSDTNTSGMIAKESTCSHVIVEYEGICFDAHDIITSKKNILGEANKCDIAIMLLEGEWNNNFYMDEYRNKGGNNKGDIIWNFLTDFESILDKLGVQYSSWL